MLNKIFLMGRLTRDPELRKTDSGTAVASFSLAVDRDFGKTESGEKETDFIDIVAWRSTADFVSKYFSKGRMAVVSGRLQMRSWTDKDGNKRRNAEVIADNVYFGDSGAQKTAGAEYVGSGDPEREEAARQNLMRQGVLKGAANAAPPAAAFDLQILEEDDGECPF